MKYLVVQKESTLEVRAVLEAVIACDLPKPRMYRASMEDLRAMGEVLRDESVMPVGSVEFVHEFMDLAGIARPEPLSYPKPLHNYLQRNIKVMRASEVVGDCFVKPVATKLFSGFVHRALADESTMDEHTRENYNLFVRLRPDEPVWVSEIVEFMAEYRYYVCNNVIWGAARYDQSDTSYPWVAHLNTVRSMIYAYNRGEPYALDVAVTRSGETVLVEVNDAYALGYYREAMSSRQYLEFLTKRWETVDTRRWTPISQF